MSQERYELALAKIKEAQDIADDNDVWWVRGLVDPLLAALRAVLDVHKPNYPWGCDYGCGDEYGDHSYPCPTAGVIIEGILE